MERIAPSARLEAQIEELLGDELAANGEKLAELGRLGARLVLQRAVEDDSSSNLSRTVECGRSGGQLAFSFARQNATGQQSRYGVWAASSVG